MNYVIYNNGSITDKSLFCSSNYVLLPVSNIVTNNLSSIIVYFAESDFNSK